MPNRVETRRVHRPAAAALVACGVVSLLGGCAVHCGKVSAPPPPGNLPDEFQRSNDQRAQETRAFDEAWRGSGQEPALRGGGTQIPPPVPAIAAGAAGGLVVGAVAAGTFASASATDASTPPKLSDEVAR